MGASEKLAATFHPVVGLQGAPEPGWGEKVIAHTKDNSGRRPFVRWGRESSDGGFRWHDGVMAPNRWSDLIDPQPVDGAS